MHLFPDHWVGFANWTDVSFLLAFVMLSPGSRGEIVLLAWSLCAMVCIYCSMRCWDAFHFLIAVDSKLKGANHFNFLYTYIMELQRWLSSISCVSYPFKFSSTGCRYSSWIEISLNTVHTFAFKLFAYVLVRGNYMDQNFVTSIHNQPALWRYCFSMTWHTSKILSFFFPFVHPWRNPYSTNSWNQVSLGFRVLAPTCFGFYFLGFKQLPKWLTRKRTWGTG